MPFAVDLGTLDTTQRHPIGQGIRSLAIDISAPSASRNALPVVASLVTSDCCWAAITAGQAVIRAAATATYENCVVSALDAL